MKGMAEEFISRRVSCRNTLDVVEVPGWEDHVLGPEGPYSVGPVRKLVSLLSVMGARGRKGARNPLITCLLCTVSHHLAEVKFTPTRLAQQRNS